MSLAASSALTSSVAPLHGLASSSKRKNVPRVGRSIHVRASNNGTIAPVTLKDDVEFFQVRDEKFFCFFFPPTSSNSLMLFLSQVRALIRPWRLKNVVTALNTMGIRGREEGRGKGETQPNTNGGRRRGTRAAFFCSRAFCLFVSEEPRSFSSVPHVSEIFCACSFGLLSQR